MLNLTSAVVYSLEICSHAKKLKQVTNIKSIKSLLMDRASSVGFVVLIKVNVTKIVTLFEMNL